jgi:formate/nitrite transporter FocA (FNT family)
MTQRPADEPPALPSFDPLLPAQMARRAEETGVAKANGNWINTLVLSVLAGAFIALGAEFFTMVTTASGAGYGLTRLIGGLAFSLGLFLVVVAGAELFTGNNLVVMAWASRRISSARLLRNWGIVYAGNFAGALATVGLVYLSKQWDSATRRSERTRCGSRTTRSTSASRRRLPSASSATASSAWRCGSVTAQGA